MSGIRAARNLLILPPLLCMMAYLLGDHPIWLEAETWRNGLWGIAGSVTGLIWIRIPGFLREAKILAKEIRIFNDQVRLMANSLNAIALGIVAFTFVQPLVAGLKFEPKHGILLIFGVFLHIQSYRVLECSKAEE